MKLTRALPAVFCALFLVGCLRSLRSPEPPVALVAPTLTLGPLPSLKGFCLMPALRASAIAPLDAVDEERRKIAFRNYYNAFHDAQDLRKYLACLEQSDTPESRKDRSLAEGWLKRAQSIADEARAFFPAGKSIVDVVETYSDIDEKTGLRRLLVTFGDGTRTVVEERFDRMPPR